MTWTGDLFMGPDSHTSDPRERLAEYLSRKFPARDGYAAKRLSNAIGCTPKAAENILGAHWPSARHLQRIVILFGRDVLDAVFGPDIDQTVARLKSEERHLEEQLARKRAQRLQAEGASPGPQERVAAPAPPGTADLAAARRKRRAGH